MLRLRAHMIGQGRRHGAFCSTPRWVSRQRPDDGVLNRGFNCRGIIPRICSMDGMAPASSEQIRTLARGIGLRQIRLVSGMILFAYVLSHFLNHSLGNISLDAMADGVKWHTAFWQFLPVAILFYSRSEERRVGKECSAR